MYDDYNAVNFNILGVLAILLKNHTVIDNQILKDTEETFVDSMVFNRVIRHMERLKRYDRTGIAKNGLIK